MKTKDKEELKVNLLIEQLNTCNRLISKGVNTRTALETTFGKEITDKTYKDIEGLQGKKSSINEKNN